MPAWQRRAARLSHAALYGLMLLLPLSGWLMASASPTQDLLRMQNLVFGRLAAPRPLRPRRRPRSRPPRTPSTPAPPPRSPLLVALHAAAALRHQFVDRDGLLARMIHGMTQKPRPGRDAAMLKVSLASGRLRRLAARHELVELGLVLRRAQLVEEGDEGVALLLETLQRLLAVGVEGGVAGARPDDGGDGGGGSSCSPCACSRLYRREGRVRSARRGRSRSPSRQSMRPCPARRASPALAPVRGRLCSSGSSFRC